MAYVALFQATANLDHIDTVKDSLVKLARESRLEPGTIRYEFYQFTDAPETFLLFGIWENEEDWRTHVSGEAHRAHDVRLPSDAWAIPPAQTRLQALDDIG